MINNIKPIFYHRTLGVIIFYKDKDKFYIDKKNVKKNLWVIGDSHREP
jgi:hypothetical protein